MSVLIGDLELNSIEQEFEQESCIRSLITHLNTIKGNGMDYVVENPRFQVLWRRVCKLFSFYSTDSMGKCSPSNILAFQEMVATTYPDLYKEISDTGTQAIQEILVAAKKNSDAVLSREIKGGVYVGPVELMEKIGIDGLATYSQSRNDLLILLSKGVEG